VFLITGASGGIGAATARAATAAGYRVVLTARGHLLLTGSVAGRVLCLGSLYSVTKWAVSALAASIRAECVGTGVRVTLIEPGLTDAGPVSPEQRSDPKLAADDIARAVMYAVREPAGVDVSEIVIRPVGQDPYR
jgi:NADP-dependent 3-hydroxy acid dehydrogenase YdfG